MEQIGNSIRAKDMHIHRLRTTIGEGAAHETGRRDRRRTAALKMGCVVLAAACRLAAGAVPGFTVTDFGAAGNGKTLDTPSIQKAIDAAAAAGGGTVVLPPGRFLTGTIFLRSHVTLELQSGATLLGSRDIKDYPLMQKGIGTDNDHSGRYLIVASGVEDVTICGGGLIDGQGDAFWEPAADPRKWIKAKSPRPSPMVEVSGSKDVHIRDVRLTNPAGWTMNLRTSERVFVRNISIKNNPLAPNSDGIDVSGSRDVLISDSRVDTGDDGIVLNSVDRDVERVTVSNCVIRSLCAALKVGWPGNKHNIRQVAISNCVLFGSNRGVAVYHPGPGAVVEDIVVSNIVFDSNTPVVLTRPIHIDLRRTPGAAEAGRIRNVSISNFTARTQGRVLMTAEAGTVLENITLRDVHLTYPYLEDPRQLGANPASDQCSNRSPEARVATAAVVAENIENLEIDGLTVTWPEGPAPEEWRIPVKRENGTFDRLYNFEYGTVAPPDFSVIWARGIRSGTVRMTNLRGSSAKVKALDILNSGVKILE